MSFPKISVIVPVYNIESCLKNCVDSILAQTYQNIEVILIDDGSTDSSPNICDYYKKIDSRVVVIHQKNKGLSIARNTGTMKATGSYLTFIDGDDFVHPDFILYLYKSIQTCNAQIAICNIKIVRNLLSKNRNLNKCMCKCLLKEHALFTMLYQKNFDISACGKLYRIENIKPYPFPEGKFYEDIPTVVYAVASAERIAWVPKKLYYYYQRSNSIVHNRTIQSLQDEIEMTDKMYDFVVQKFPRIESAALCKKFSNYCQVLRESSAYPRNKTIRKDVVCFLQENASQIKRDSNARLKNRLAAFLIEINPSFIERLR